MPGFVIRSFQDSKGNDACGKCGCDKGGKEAAVSLVECAGGGYLKSFQVKVLTCAFGEISLVVVLTKQRFGETSPFAGRGPCPRREVRVRQRA